MSTVEIKTELQGMIKKETDLKVLQAIHVLLLNASLDPDLREKLVSHAPNSEKDIEAGRVYTKAEV